MRLCNSKPERDEDTECSPGCTGCKRKHTGDQEECGRYNAYCSSLHVFYESAYVISKAKAVCHGFESPRKCQHENRRSHGFHSLRDAAHAFLEADGMSDYVIYNDEYKCHETAHRKTYRCIGIRECCHESVSVEESACIDHSDYAAYNEHNYREYEVENDTLIASLLCSICCTCDLIMYSKEISIFNGIHLESRHSSIIEFHKNECAHHDECKDRVEVIWDALDEE